MTAALLSAWFAVYGASIPIEELTRHLPPYAVAVTSKALAEQCRDWLDRQMKWNPCLRDRMYPLYQEACRRVYVWDRLCLAQGDMGHTDAYRRTALKELRQEIGEADFWDGRLPCPFIEATLQGE
jgi:hypothetical protein